MTKLDTDLFGGMANPLHRHSKIDLQITLLIVRSFAYGLSVKKAASASGVTEKSVRGLYLQLRERLQEPDFAQWHKANRRLLFITDNNVEEAIRADFFEALSQCYSSTNCFRNYRDGKRKNRLCRKCTLPDYLTDKEVVTEAIEFNDSIRAFYNNIGIAAEDVSDPHIFKQRVIHTVVIASAARETPRMANGGFDYTSNKALSFRILFETTVANLANISLSKDQIYSS